MPSYAISDELIARASADRGKAHPWDAIPVARTALIVIDMQNYFVAPSSQGEAETARDIVPAINRLAGALRERGGNVIWMQNTTTNTREDWSVRHELLLPEKAEIRLAAMELGAEGYQLWPTLDVRAEDTRIGHHVLRKDGPLTGVLAWSEGIADRVRTDRATFRLPRLPRGLRAQPPGTPRIDTNGYSAVWTASCQGRRTGCAPTSAWPPSSPPRGGGGGGTRGSPLRRSGRGSRGRAAADRAGSARCGWRAGRAA